MVPELEEPAEVLAPSSYRDAAVCQAAKSAPAQAPRQGNRFAILGTVSSTNMVSELA